MAKKKIKNLSDEERRIAELEDMKRAAKASLKASEEMAKYLKENHLNPTLNWANDPIHGEKIRKWIQIIRIGQMKSDTAKWTRLTKKPKLRDMVKKTDKKKTKEEVKAAKKTAKVVTSYSYPKIDGQEMSPALKKKYRSKMRALLKANMDEKAASKKALETIQNLASKADEVPAKKVKKIKKEAEEAPAEKPAKKVKKIKKVKKVRKEED